jgi:hypothetical protein
MDDDLSIAVLAAGTRIAVVPAQRSAGLPVLRLMFVTVKRLELGVPAILL